VTKIDILYVIFQKLDDRAFGTHTAGRKFPFRCKGCGKNSV